MSPFLVRAFLGCILVGIAAVTATSDRGYRCFRPFKALDGFSPKFMNRKDNCHFDFLRIDDASASISCDQRSTDETSSESVSVASTGGCTVTVRFNATATVPKNTLVHDGARYTLKLGKGGKQIHYKGFDGRGFSACCSLASSAECEWVDVNGTKTHVMKQCPLHQSKGTTFSGAISRPLHTFVPGQWSAFLMFHTNTVSDDSLTGRLVVPFEVPPESEVASSSENAVVPVQKEDF